MSKKVVSNITSLIIALIAVIILCIGNEEKTQETFVSEEDLKVWYIDVGQADSILIQNENQAMLIDAGNNEDGKDVVDFITSKGITTLDYVVGTHPHEDHIGGLDDVIRSFEIKNIWMPKIQTNTKTFEDVLDAISQKNMQVKAPSKGEAFTIGKAEGEVMTESILDSSNLNLSSIIIRLEFGNQSFLFMGDSEIENEEIRYWPKTNVLKVGHHGSNTSSSNLFLSQIKPETAVIMVGGNNKYGHPKQEVVERLNKLNTKIYRTDENKTILITSDGNTHTVQTNQ